MVFKLTETDLDNIEDGMERNNAFRLVSGIRGRSIDLEEKQLRMLLSRGLPQETIEILAKKISDWGARPWHTIWRREPWNPLEDAVG